MKRIVDSVVGNPHLLIPIEFSVEFAAFGVIIVAVIGYVAVLFTAGWLAAAFLGVW